MVKLSTVNNLKGFGLGGNDDQVLIAHIRRIVRLNEIGEFARMTVVNRAKKAVGAHDSPMPPLKGSNVRVFAARVNGKPTFRTVSGYAQWKSKHGLQPVRDLVGDGKQGGHMLDNFTVRENLTTESQVKIAFTAQKQRQKALANEKRSSFLQFSPNDQRLIIDFVSKMWNAGVTALSGVMKSGRFRRAA